MAEALSSNEMHAANFQCIWVMQGMKFTVSDSSLVS